MRTTQQLRELWGPPCNFRRATVSLYGAGKVTVDYRILSAVYALNRVLAKHRYATRWHDTGAYVCRRITGGSGYSLHAYGIAIDINWQSNPYGTRLITNMPRAMVDEIKAIRTNNGAQVWGWGGDYHNVKDAMHFEIVASPAELLNGIRTTTAPPTDEEFTVDAEAKAAFAAVMKELAVLKGGAMVAAARIEELEDTRLKPTTRRVRQLHEAAGLPENPDG